jgi:hypothetical protein
MIGLYIMARYCEMGSKITTHWWTGCALVVVFLINLSLTWHFLMVGTGVTGGTVTP